MPIKRVAIFSLLAFAFLTCYSMLFGERVAQSVIQRAISEKDDLLFAPSESLKT